MLVVVVVVDVDVEWLLVRYSDILTGDTAATCGSPLLIQKLAWPSAPVPVTFPLSPLLPPRHPLPHPQTTILRPPPPPPQSPALSSVTSNPSLSTMAPAHGHLHLPMSTPGHQLLHPTTPSLWPLQNDSSTRPNYIRRAQMIPSGLASTTTENGWQRNSRTTSTSTPSCVPCRSLSRQPLDWEYWHVSPTSPTSTGGAHYRSSESPRTRRTCPGCRER